MGLLMEGFFIISCEIPVFPVRFRYFLWTMSTHPHYAGKITAWQSCYNSANMILIWKICALMCHTPAKSLLKDWFLDLTDNTAYTLHSFSLERCKIKDTFSSPTFKILEKKVPWIIELWLLNLSWTTAFSEFRYIGIKSQIINHFEFDINKNYKSNIWIFIWQTNNKLIIKLSFMAKGLYRIST